ncbi:MAG TPA: hypothetical protein VN282_22695 [Pyrinomonadaceae bacterium]|nr:hypothetical protein [Pyrinomonadaceae bacterium]
MASRPLRKSEIEFARQVFEDRLPYDRVYLSSRFLPFNEGTAATVASLSAFVPVRAMRSYTIFAGPEVFDEGADDPRFRDTFIHELTHVWQGYHGVLGWAYMAQSLLWQGYAVLTQGHRNKAYDYEPGAAWGDYNVEQQALLVQDWYLNGMREDDERFPYIAGHIRAAKGRASPPKASRATRSSSRAKG